MVPAQLSLFDAPASPADLAPAAARTTSSRELRLGEHRVA